MCVVYKTYDYNVRKLKIVFQEGGDKIQASNALTDKFIPYPNHIFMQTLT